MHEHFFPQVLMKDIVTPVPPEEVRQVIKKCLENAALVNYTRISEYAKIEGLYKYHVEWFYLSCNFV